ncbi:MAG: N-methylhydantoinase [Thermoleophilaceae bacterium]|jgi:N-methylhydantoinase B|nr:N-methylhydantoinase [Thermoleophilaceae bacterium]
MATLLEPNPKQAAAITPLIVEIVEGTCESAKMEMEAAIDRTARSLLIKEQHDYQASIFTPGGESISTISFCPHVDPILEKWPASEVYEDDVFIWNDCYLSAGGVGHLPDISVTRPVIVDGTLVAWVNAFGHVDDIGGVLPGGMPAAAVEVFQEGIQIPPIKLVDRGRLNEGVYEMILRNTRFPEAIRGDIDGLVHSLGIGVQRITELCRRYGPETVVAACERSIERCATSLQNDVFPLMKDGEYYFEDFIEWEDVTPDEPRSFIRIATKMIKRGNEVIWDYSGTDAQVKGSLNLPGNDRYYEKLMGAHFRTLRPELFLNEGVCRVTQAKVPDGTVLSPKYPAATSNRMWALQVMWENALAIFNIAGAACPACSNTNTLYGIYGYDKNGEYFFAHELPGAGQGGRPFADGLDVANLAPESRNSPAEIIESKYPVIEETCDIGIDGGGAGKFRGGNGLVKEIRVLEDGDLTVITGRYALPCWGAHGGKPGRPHKYILNPGTPGERVYERGKFDKEPVKAGDLIRIYTAGGGGWGDPLERETHRVLGDVVRGLVSGDAALSEYGVVLEEQKAGGLTVNEAETAKARDRIRNDRGELKLIDRGPEFYRLAAEGRLPVTCEDGYWVQPDE